MNDTSANRTRTLSKAAALVALVVLVACLAGTGVRTSGRAESLRMMSLECHPVWREFESGAFKQGDSLDALLAAHQPAWQRALGDVTVCEFHPPRDPAVHLSPVRVTAVNGRLVSAIAGSCNWWHTFFDATQDSATLCALAPSRQN